MTQLASYILFTVIGFFLGAFIVCYYTVDDKKPTKPEKPRKVDTIKKRTDEKIHNIKHLSNDEVDSLLAKWRRQHGDTNAVNN